MAHSGRRDVETTLDADDAFATVTDVARLPEWNRAITAVVERPERLEVGTEWVVELHALGQTWRSRSRVEELDRERGVFAYRSMTDDGNPSFALWRWEVSPGPGGARVEVTWELHPRSFWRRRMLVWVRRGSLDREVADALEALAALPG